MFVINGYDRRLRILIYSLTLLMTAPAALSAQKTEDWLGRRVVTRFGTVLRVNGNVIDNEKHENTPRGTRRSLCRIYRVEAVNGAWLWLRDENSSIGGWVTAEWLIPFDQAIDYFTNEIRTNPANSTAYVRRGFVWQDKKEYDIAIADFNEAIRIDPSSEVGWLDRGVSWSDKKDYDKAIADYNEAIHLDPKFATAYLNRGLAWFAKKDYNRAIADYSEAIRLNPRDAVAYGNRGNVWSTREEYDRAIADYGEVIRLNPRDALAYNNRGNVWLDKKDYGQAISDYDAAIRLDPKFAIVYSNRANAWRDQKDYGQAIADYDEAIRLDPRSVYAHFNRSVTRMILRRAEAVDGFKAAIDLDQGKGLYSTYAVILGNFAARQASNEAEARWFLDQVSRLDASAWPYPTVRFLRGELDEAGLLAQAIDDGKRTEARCFLGLDHLVKGHKDEALAHFRWVRDHGKSTSTEYTIALAELDRLGEPAVPARR